MDSTRIPFSVYGSYFAVALHQGDLYIRNISGDAQSREVLKVELMQPSGVPQPFAIAHGDGLLRLQGETLWAEICFEDVDCLRIRGCGTLRLTTGSGVKYGCGAAVFSQRFLFANYSSLLNVAIESLHGSLAVDNPWTGTDSPGFTALITSTDGMFEAAVELYRGPSPMEREHNRSFANCADRWHSHFSDYLEKTVKLPERYTQARRLAAYLNWSSIVAPDGLMKRYGMYMSKNWMTNIWSWDHCFNAIALAYHDPSLAWDQYMVMFDRQDASGALPDCFNNCNIVWQYCKPPIHGWTIRRMFHSNPAFGMEHIREAYGPLSRWTKWWFASRDYDRDGMPQYHHGNDSGWDNSTVFAQGVPVESPDLAAFLLIQMYVLADFAGKLGLPEEAQQWRTRIEALRKSFEDHFVKQDGTLVPCLSGSHIGITNQSLLPYIALVAGDLLPQSVRQRAVQDLKDGGFITTHGLATEAISSTYYTPDGYWRGPIWAPSTMLMIDGLAACGETALARQLVESFADMCADQGFAENFDAISGRWLRDPAYTWTSSVFLILAHEYLL